MEISVSKKNINYYEGPVTSEIIIKIKEIESNIERLEIDEQLFEKLLEEYVDKVENFGDIDLDLEAKIFDLGIDQEIFAIMKKELEMTNTREYQTDQDNNFTSFINFPWKEWKEKLLIIKK